MKIACTLCFLAVASVAFAQQPGTTGPLTNQRIIELVQSGVRQDELARIIAAAPEVSFDLSPTGTSAMMQAGVSEDTIKAMAAREAGISSTAPAQQNPQPSPLTRTSSDWGEKPARVDIFGGYSYLNFETNGLTPSRQNANGWESSAAVSVNRWIAAEGDFSDYYKNYVIEDPFVGPLNLNFHDYAFLGGPRVNAGPVFFHALFGGDTLTASAGALSISQTDFASAFGGGVQSKVFGHHWAIRTSADYVLSHHAFLRIFNSSAPALTQNDFRVAGGIVYVFGSLDRR